MRKFIILIALVTLIGLVNQVQADPIPIGLPDLKLPTLKSGALFVVGEGDRLSWVNTATLVKYPIKGGKWGVLDLDVGYALKDQIVGGIALELGSLEQIGLQLPLLDLSIGIGGIYDTESEELNFGLYATIISVKF